MNFDFIDRNWFIDPTGDPFADIGGFVIEYYQEKRPGKTILELIEEVTSIYVKRWENNLHSFFLNSTITHNSNKGQKGIDNTLAFYKGLLQGKNSVEGYCRITGQKGQVFSGGRDNHIMSGSGTLINFHHGFESGIMLSKEVLIRMLFVPLGVEQLGDKVALLTSNNEEITRYFVRRNVDNNLKDIASGISKSVLKSDFSNPTNALFDYVNQCIMNVRSVTYDQETGKSITKGVVLNLFHFTNFGAKPAIDLYTLPADIFSFYTTCFTNFKYKKDWQNFVFRFYRSSKFKNAEFDETSVNWYNAKEVVNYPVFKLWRNNVFEYLLKGKSLLPLFLRYSKDYSLNFNIVELYQISIRNMERETLSKIKELADFIVNDRSDDEIKKVMTRLNKAKNNNELRIFLIKLLDENYKKGNANPLFSIEEYTEYLFPDGSYWREIRDLLIIAIYQKLHEIDKRVELELAEDEIGEEN